MRTKKNLLIVLSILVGILLVSIFMKREEDVNDIIANVDDNLILKNDRPERRDIDNKLQLNNSFHVIKKPNHQPENDIHEPYETESLVSWVGQVDALVFDQELDASSKIEKVFNWLNDSNTPNEIRVKLYRALVQLKPKDHIEEIFSLIDKENNIDIKLAGMEALALTGKQLIVLGHAEGSLILDLLKGLEQQTEEPIARKKLNNLVAYMEGVLTGNTNELINIEYLTGRNAYVWDLSAKLENKENLKYGLTGLLNDVSALVDQDKELLNEEYKKLNFAYLDYFSNGFSGEAPNHQDMDYFFEKIKPQNVGMLTEDAVSRYRIWFTAYSYSSERDSNDYNNFIINELKETNSPVAVLVLIENGLKIVDQLDPVTREKLVSLLEENSLAVQGTLSGEVDDALSFLVQ